MFHDEETPAMIHWIHTCFSNNRDFDHPFHKTYHLANQIVT